jgi:DEAD/DEAH box helicase domain-containing protein
MTGLLPTLDPSSVDVLPSPGLPGHHTPRVAADPGPAIDSLVEELSRGVRFVHRHRDLPRPGRAADLERPLPAALEAHLPISSWWSHQAEAIDHIRARRSVVIATGTGSGKSLCYQVPAAELALEGGTALLVFPTKALAHDQLTSFSAWAPPPVTIAAYDGDCSPVERHWVRSRAQIVLTNPEMLHQGILANHRRWDRLLRGVQLVVLDELHTLRGVFGSHVSHVLRRLRRLVRLYSGRDPVFAFTSATIGEPAALAERLCGTPVEAVITDSAPRGQRNVVLWNPQATGPHDRGRSSLHAETAGVAADLVATGLRTLVFCRSRRMTELVANGVRERLRRRGDPREQAVRAYRSGYLQDERREIEAALAGGTLSCVVATNALELGIDVEGLDAVVLAGYPGTTASFHQQIGRVGRRGRSSLAVLVAGDDQLDQWMMHHPRELFRRPPERAVVNPSNHHVLLPHLACAAEELPLRADDERLWPDDLDDGVRELVCSDRLQLRHSATGTVACWAGRGAPASTIGLRSSSQGEIAVRRPDGSLLATVDATRAFDTVHPGAIYLHQGASWLVRGLDLQSRRATVEPSDGSTYTQTRRSTQVRLLGTDQSRTVASVGVHIGRVEVTTRVTGFVTRSVDRHRVLTSEQLDLPASTLVTTGVWWTFGTDTLDAAEIADHDLPGALHAIEHASIGILPLFAICDRWDVGGISTPWMPDTSAATVLIHDGQPGGSGTAPLAFDAAAAHLRATSEVLSDCGCVAGCPGCVQSPKCGSGNEPLHKRAAAALLEVALAEGPIRPGPGGAGPPRAQRIPRG